MNDLPDQVPPRIVEELPESLRRTCQQTVESESAALVGSLRWPIASEGSGCAGWSRNEETPGRIMVQDQRDRIRGLLRLAYVPCSATANSNWHGWHDATLHRSAR